MCRLLGYLGPPISLGSLVTEPPHSLARQSWQPRELRTATVNADGWGAGFFLEADEAPCLYVSTLPIWADANTAHLGRAIRSHSLVAAVRSATDPSSVAQSNTQPFASGRLAFVHNGFIDRFRKTVQRRLCAELSDERYAGIVGTSDSEHLLALIVHHLDRLPVEGGDPSGGRLLRAIAGAIRQLDGWAIEAGTKASSSIVVTDGASLVALRSATDGEPPSLYVLEGPSAMAPGLIVASEPLDEDPGWRRIPEGHAVVATVGGAPKVLEIG